MLTFEVCLFVWFVSVHGQVDWEARRENHDTHTEVYVFNDKHAM